MDPALKSPEYIYIYLYKKRKEWNQKRGSVYADLGFDILPSFDIYIYIDTNTNCVLFLTESCQSTLAVSHKGHDDRECGVNYHPCHTLSYTLQQRAKDDDVIQINGQDDGQDGTPYPIKKQHQVLRNITLIGTGSRAMIAGEFSVVDSYLFADASRGLNTSPEQVSINLVNLKLIGIGIIKLKNTLTTLNIQVVNCTVSKLKKSPIVDSSAAQTTVILKNSIICHVSRGLQVKSREFSLIMTSSKIDNSGRSYPGQDCPQFIVTDHFESLVAHFSKSSFKYTFLIDLAASRKKNQMSP